MAHPIDSTLTLLQDVMSAHRQALARAASKAPPTVVLPADQRARLLLRLLAGIEVRAGIEVSQATAERLLRALAAIDTAELEAFVERLDRLPASHEEWLALIESLTVHETYVMRDPAQLQFFAAQLPALIAEAKAKKFYCLRFWSVGCATGEEAYSIAALVYDALLAAEEATAAAEGAINLNAPWRIEVLGSDISRPVLNVANTGVYDTGPLSSFRSETAVVLPHFPVSGAPAEKTIARAAAAHLKKAVRFSHFNLMDDPLPQENFDAVFCRNVLIYFSDRAKRAAQEKLRSAVRPGGFLLLGPTDTLVDPQSFDGLWGPGAMIYRRRRIDG